RINVNITFFISAADEALTFFIAMRASSREVIRLSLFHEIRCTPGLFIGGWRSNGAVSGHPGRPGGRALCGGYIDGAVVGADGADRLVQWEPGGGDGQRQVHRVAGDDRGRRKWRGEW